LPVNHGEKEVMKKKISRLSRKAMFLNGFELDQHEEQKKTEREKLTISKGGLSNEATQKNYFLFNWDRHGYVSRDPVHFCRKRF
jgi:hypothetical protein